MAQFKLHRINTEPVKRHITSTTGIAFVVLGVLLLVFSFVASLTSNTILFVGLLFVVLGIAAYVYGIKRESAS